MQYDGAKILDAIRQINSACSQKEVIDALSGFIAPYGFNRIFLGQLVNPANIPMDQIMFVTNWPVELVQERQKRLAILFDPIAKCALRSKRPFKWSEAYRFATKKGQMIVDLTHDFGISDGVMFPMHSLESVTGGVSLGGELLDHSSTEITEIELVCQTAYYRLEQLLGPFPYQKVADLTPRETEIVQFVAAGKTNWEIATILGIEADTVKKCLNRVSQKLRTTNRAHTVANAIASNQIFP